MDFSFIIWALTNTEIEDYADGKPVYVKDEKEKICNF